MISPQDHDRIDRLTKNLYSRKSTGQPADVRAPIAREEYAVADDWQEKPREETTPPKKSTFFKKIFIGALVFFFLSSGVAAFMFFGGFNIISSQNVDIQVSGPVSISGGEELALEINVQNKNNTDLEVADLSVEYPSGTKSSENILADLPRYHESLGAIPSGKTVSRTVKAILFGQENASVQIKIQIEYKVKGSSATFTKEKAYEVALGTSPVSIKVDGLKEVNSNQPLEYTVTLTSNSNTTLQNILLTAEYPFGFTFEHASVSPLSGTNVWSIGTMEPGEKKTLTVLGRLEGQDGEERVFHWNVGIKNPTNDKILGTTFLSLLNSVTLKRPFIGVDLALDGDTSKQHVATRGHDIKAELTWKNNLPSQIVDGQIEVSINGKVLDRSSISAYNGGFYRSVDNTILWQENDTPALARINPGDSDSVTFSFAAYDLSRPEYTALTNPEIEIEISVKGKRVGDSNVPEEIISTVKRTVKIGSNLTLIPKILYSTGPFKNTGPIPPKVEKPTTYTVFWNVLNASNNITNARVTATLPPYVKWLSNFNPSSEKITYNPEKNELVWQVGSLSAKTGYQTPPRQVAFQIQFLPSLAQVGSTVDLVGEAHMTAHDSFTDATLDTVGSSLGTTLTGDPVYGENTDKVGQ